MKRLLLVGLVIISIYALTGCNGDKGRVENDVNKQDIVKTQVQDTQKDAGEKDIRKDEEFKMDAVQYVGQIDANSIETKVVGVQSEKDSYRVFRFSNEIREKFYTFELKKDDYIKVKYKIDDNQAKVIYGIEKYNQSAKREKNKKIEVKVEGEKEMRDAQLKVSDSLGYSFYLLNNFEFSAEEPGKDIIMSKYDGDFYVRLEKLDEKTNLEAYKKSLMNGYKDMGKVIEREPATIFTEKFRDSKFWFSVDIPKSQNIKTQTTVNHLVKDFGGNLYAFTFHFPLKEAAEGITPSLWAMVSTIERD